MALTLTPMQVLDTEPYYQACRGRLSERGIFVTNLLGHNKGI